MTGSDDLIPSEDINAFPQLCGCSGKPSTNDVVEPAVHKLINQNNINIKESLDAGIVSAVSDPTHRAQIIARGSQWRQAPPEVLVATFVDGKTANNTDNFRTFLNKEYDSIPHGSTIIKGHTVNIVESDVNFSIADFIIPSGTDREGYLGLNIDIIHALPQQSGTTQASVAVSNTMNDCYTVGGYRERTIRPIVIHPPIAEVSKSDVEQVYKTVTGKQYDLLEPLVVEKDIKSWLFGVSASTYLAHEPPRFYDHLSPGDQILLHRPIGALAAYTAIVAGDSDQPPERVVDMLTTDHGSIARVISKYCPQTAGEFDESKHIKFATDISGSGIRELEQPLARSSSKVDIELTNMPTIESELLNPAIEKWTIPDITVETNGPLALCGASEVIERIQNDLNQMAEANPAIAGQVTDGSGLLRSKNVNMERYIETYIQPERP